MPAAPPMRPRPAGARTPSRGRRAGGGRGSPTARPSGPDPLSIANQQETGSNRSMASGRGSSASRQWQQHEMELELDGRLFIPGLAGFGCTYLPKETKKKIEKILPN
uniref:Uncharacterized protein n=1 Tax=Arundo donax TaxID=35708 RepID=A0A0A9EJQ9_ARUDO